MFSFLQEIEKILNTLDLEIKDKPVEDKIILDKKIILQLNGEGEFKVDLIKQIKDKWLPQLNQNKNVYTFFLTTGFNDKENYLLNQKLFKEQLLFIKNKKRENLIINSKNGVNTVLDGQLDEKINFLLEKSNGDKGFKILVKDVVLNKLEVVKFFQSFQNSLQQIVENENNKEIKDKLSTKLNELEQNQKINNIAKMFQIAHEIFIYLKLNNKRVIVFYDLSKASLDFLKKYFYKILLLNNQYDFYIDDFECKKIPAAFNLGYYGETLNEVEDLLKFNNKVMEDLIGKLLFYRVITFDS